MEIIDEIVSLKDLFHAFSTTHRRTHKNFKSTPFLSKKNPDLRKKNYESGYFRHMAEYVITLAHMHLDAV